MRGTFVRIGGPMLAVAVGVLVVGAGTVSAHIDPDPPAVEAGTSATVAFGVEHGCAGSPTVALDIELPEELTDVQPVAKTGWEAVIADGVLTFSGGPLDANTADTFSITFTAPTTPGTLLFPTVQKCTEGETAWIDVAAEGDAEPEHPAPAVRVTSGPPTADDLAPPDDETEVGADTTAVASVTTDPSTGGSNDGGTDTGLIVVGVLAAIVVVVGGGYLVIRSRGNRA